jgi:hypothetical protein
MRLLMDVVCKATRVSNKYTCSRTVSVPFWWTSTFHKCPFLSFYFQPYSVRLQINLSEHWKEETIWYRKIQIACHLLFLYKTTQNVDGRKKACHYNTFVIRELLWFWDITPCRQFKVHRRFGGTCRLYLQGRIIRQARNQHESRG